MGLLTPSGGGGSNPNSSLREVVLPAPLGPRNPKISPRLTDRDRSATATVAPNCLRKQFVSMAFAAADMDKPLLQSLGHLNEFHGPQGSAQREYPTTGGPQQHRSVAMSTSLTCGRRRCLHQESRIALHGDLSE